MYPAPDTGSTGAMPARPGRWHWLPALLRRDADTEFMRESSAAMLEGPRYFSHWILLLTVVFCITAFLWAAWATVDEFTVGEGKVIPSSQLQVVQNLEGGIVSEIIVKVGQVVQKGALLMRIDDTRFTASSREGLAKDQALQARIARLAAESGGTAFSPPAQLVHDNPVLVAEERALYLRRQQEFQTSLSVLRQQLAQRRQELSEKRARLEQLEQSYGLISKELAMIRPMAQQGAMSEVDLLRLQRQVSDIQGELDATRLALPRLTSAVNEVQQKIEETGSRFRADAMRELSASRGEQTALSAANTALDDRVNRTLVRAPVAGTIKQIKVNTLGGVVQPGMDLLEIVPADDTLLIEAKVRPADIAFLYPGQKALVKLSAYDFSIYGGFPATLEYISADTLAPEKPGDKQESYYQIRVRTKHSIPNSQRARLAIIPGMVATVDIKTGSKTILHYLLKPIIKTKEMALRER